MTSRSARLKLQMEAEAWAVRPPHALQDGCVVWDVTCCWFEPGASPTGSLIGVVQQPKIRRLCWVRQDECLDMPRYGMPGPLRGVENRAGRMMGQFPCNRDLALDHVRLGKRHETSPAHWVPDPEAPQASPCRRPSFRLDADPTCSTPSSRTGRQNQSRLAVEEGTRRRSCERFRRRCSWSSV